jgi:hypothetical protein
LRFAVVVAMYINVMVFRAVTVNVLEAVAAFLFVAWATLFMNVSEELSASKCRI